MKLVAGHRYLKGPDGFIMPYSELMHKASGFTDFIQAETVVDEYQDPANEKIRGAAPKNVQVAVAQVKAEAAAPKVKPKMQHHDITAGLTADLKAQDVSISALDE